MKVVRQYRSLIISDIGGMTFVADPKKPVGGHVLVSYFVLILLNILTFDA